MPLPYVLHPFPNTLSLVFYLPPIPLSSLSSPSPSCPSLSFPSFMLHPLPHKSITLSYSPSLFPSLPLLPLLYHPHFPCHPSTLLIPSPSSHTPHHSPFSFTLHRSSPSYFPLTDSYSSTTTSPFPSPTLALQFYIIFSFLCSPLSLAHYSPSRYTPVPSLHSLLPFSLPLSFLLPLPLPHIPTLQSPLRPLHFIPFRLLPSQLHFPHPIYLLSLL